MRLEVGDLAPLGPGDLGQRADLLGHLVGQQPRLDVARHPAEVLPVGVRHLRTQRHPTPYGLGADRLHGRPGAGVEAARHVGTGHHRQQAGVVGDLLAQVCVEINLSRHGRMRFRRSGHRPSVPARALRSP